ncbi:MAG TPA: type II toxin-antitoxin system HicB family antitoxin [Thermoanaerobaculia bacterium]|nr:type II toxin-antitoxin system HicB family antitoxin [Thermoanaerobaculia bacterium]
MELKVVLEPGEDGFIVAHCPSLKSCWSQGRTREEALQNIREAVELYLQPERRAGAPSPAKRGRAGEGVPA